MVRVNRVKKTIVAKHFGVGLRTVERALTDEHENKQALDTKQQKAGWKFLKGVQLPEMRRVSNVRRDCAAQTATFVLAIIAAARARHDGGGASNGCCYFRFSKPYSQRSVRLEQRTHVLAQPEQQLTADWVSSLPSVSEYYDGLLTVCIGGKYACTYTRNRPDTGSACS